MNKFWEWMKENYYAKWGFHDEWVIPNGIDVNTHEETKLTNQMLTGYKIEYLIEKDKDFIFILNNLLCAEMDNRLNIEYIDNLLNQRIEELK